MTSPSLKNHPTTASLPATRSSDRAWWQRCLAGALCLVVSGAIPANDREVAKPLDRLKQRSARQRWRELRGEWVPAPDVSPQTLPGEGPQPAIAPFSSPIPNRVTPIPTEAPPAVSGSTTVEPGGVSPVPAPLDATPEVERPVVDRPGAKPPLDPQEPMYHEGSFGDVSLETRVAVPRERVTIALPHWPFEDDLDLVRSIVVDDTTAEVVETEEPTSSNSAPSSASSVKETPALPVLTFPIQVAEVPVSEPSTPSATPAAPAVEASLPPPEDPLASSHQSGPAPIHQLKSIKDIQPFYDYVPEGAESNIANTKSPKEMELVLQGSLERNHSILPVYWQASNVSHNPLYFEDSGLERNGHSFSDAVQPFVSVGKFGAQVVALPYSIALDPVWKHESPLGHYRPGECAPKRHLALPINGHAAVVAATAYTGIIYLIP